ncbi:MAG TPA: AMP-binding protein [Mycobacterium sp.]|nr:AMP-binding protein [Mycobacterium sp.]
MADDGLVLAFEDRRYSRSQLDGLVRGFAGALERRGVRAGQRVALMSSNRPEFLAAVLAIWRVGAAVVLISPTWKHAEVEHAFALTEPVDAIGDHSVLADIVLDEALSEEPGGPVELRLDDEALLVFSSGTTGMPKAVRHTHRSFAAAVRQWRRALAMTSRDRIQVVTPPSHILGLLNIMTALASRAAVRLHARFDIEALLHDIEADQITIEMVVAPIALALAAHPALEDHDLSSLRYFMWGATPVTADVAETVTRRTGIGWVPAYGTTELPVIACNPLEGARLDTIGRPVPGVSVRVVSPETGNPVGAGEIGEIQARSESLMAGYLPATATGDAMCDGWYRTGDVGQIDIGAWLRITDRAKEMIKVRGFSVAPAEIEAVLYGHPAVKDCAVFGVPDPLHGEAVVAAVSVRGGALVSADELTALVGERLATYKRPSRVVFVDEIPRLPSGKVLRRVVKERYGCPADS